MADFAERIVLVTGAERGIGARIASQFAAEGASVHVTAIRGGDGRALATSPFTPTVHSSAASTRSSP